LQLLGVASNGPWSLDISALTRWRCRCAPEGRLESRPAIYRRYWYLEFDLVPKGRSKLGLAVRNIILVISTSLVFAVM